MSVQVRITKVNRPNFTGTVIEHEHGDGRWHWAQDAHGGKYAGAHDGLAKLGHKFLGEAGTEANKKLYVSILKGTAARVPIRVQGVTAAKAKAEAEAAAKLAAKAERAAKAAAKKAAASAA